MDRLRIVYLAYLAYRVEYAMARAFARREMVRRDRGELGPHPIEHAVFNMLHQRELRRRRKYS